MSKPEDIPQDVWGVAVRVWAEMRTVEHVRSDEWADGDAEEIARAIMAAKEGEREVCAAIIDAHMLCENALGDEVLLPRGSSGNKVGFAYAAAIRKRGNVSTVRKSENQEG